MSAGTIAVAVIDDAALPMWDMYELGVVCTVFGIEHTDLADPWYRLRLCGTRPGARHSGDGFVLNTGYGMFELIGADTVIVPSVPEACMHGERELPPGLIEALRAAHAAGARLVSLCNGVFALAEAGLLDGRRATAHWEHTEILAARFPEVVIDGSVLYVDEGRVLTSAGLSAGLDLCLHLVRCDLGARVANQLARRMVVPAHRPGGQAQFVEMSVPVSDDDSLAPVMEWTLANLDRPLTVEDMAEHANMSSRTFHRRLLAVTGTTPMRWLLSQRIARAQALLESTDLPIPRISEHSGLGSANNLRRHFALHVGLSPSEYRRGFAS